MLALLIRIWSSHGGGEVSKHLQAKLHSQIQDALPESIPQVVKDYRALGGYLRRYRGGPLSRFRELTDDINDKKMGLDEMCVLAFLGKSFSHSFLLLLCFLH